MILSAQWGAELNAPVLVASTGNVSAAAWSIEQPLDGWHKGGETVSSWRHVHVDRPSKLTLCFKIVCSNFPEVDLHLVIKSITHFICLDLQNQDGCYLVHPTHRLWTLLKNVHLDEEIEDTIVWNLTESGEYSVTSAYHAQFFGAMDTHINKFVWKG
jgi:hypothetical protein